MLLQHTQPLLGVTLVGFDHRNFGLRHLGLLPRVEIGDVAVQQIETDGVYKRRIVKEGIKALVVFGRFWRRYAISHLKSPVCLIEGQSGLMV